MQRNATVFYSWYADAAMTLKRLTEGLKYSSDPVATQCTQSFFQSQSMKDYAVEMQQIAERINRSVKSAPVLQQSPGDQYQNDEVDDDGYEQHVGDDDEEEDNGDEDEGDDENGDDVEDEEDGDDMEDDGYDNEKEVTVDVGTDLEGTVAASIVSDEVAIEKAREVSTQQIMEAVQFYSAPEFKDAANRDDYIKDTNVDVCSTRDISVTYKRRKVAEEEVAVEGPTKFDREVLLEYYSKEDVDEAKRKFYANAAAAKEQEQTMDMGVIVAGEPQIADKKNEEDGPTDADPPVTQFLFSSAEIIEAEPCAEMPAREDQGIGEVTDLVKLAPDATGTDVHVIEGMNAETDKDDEKIEEGNAQVGIQCESTVVVTATLDDAVQVDSKTLEYSGPDDAEPEKADNALVVDQNIEVAPPATQFLFSTSEICDAERAAEQHYEEGAGNGGGATNDERLLKGDEQPEYVFALQAKEFMDVEWTSTVYSTADVNALFEEHPISVQTEMRGVE
ncbi:uncharacterized protein LOC141598325 [Silene latifolia]|uniref:uncharacterized protein LOC141598325 n=1 Tax=Silene latifolia TaxID=37657 RepID=UPI003D78344C